MKTQAKQLERERKAYAKRLRVEKLYALRAELRVARAARAAAIKHAREACRASKLEVRARLKTERARLLEQLRANARAERASARAACDAKKRAAKDEGSHVARTRAELRAEREYLAQLRRIEHGHAQARRAHGLTSKSVRASESDDEVRSNIDPALVALFNRVRGQIKGSARKTRTEAFLEYVEEHPGEYLDAIDDRTDDLVRELEAREARLAKTVPRRRYTAEELAAVPF